MDRSAEEIFYDALDRPGPERAAFVDAACAHDPALAAEVRSLLGALEQSGSFLSGRVVDAGAALDDAGPDPLLGTQVGAFTVLEPIGSGGMGRVYLAERREGDFDQRVALKVLRRGFGPEGLRRFRNECRVLAQLEHPHVARMIDGGTTADGLAWIAMEHVDGVPIDAHCEEQGLGLRARLDLFRQLCGAVQHAHMHRTIHRDLKPGNVLVDSADKVKLVDFGIARTLEAADDRELTRTGMQALTPAYASPEQREGLELSTATDIWSLGVLLHLLLTGRLPEGGPGHTTRPSAHGARALRGDLDTIVLMCLRAEPGRRYPSAAALADDLHNYLRGLPVDARPDTLGYRAGKFVRRNRVAVGAAALLALLLVASSVVVYGLYREAARERAAAELAREEALQNERAAEAAAQFLTDLFESARPDQGGGEALSARELLDRGAASLEGELVDQPALRARVLRTVGDLYLSLSEPELARPWLEEAVALSRQAYEGPHLQFASALRAHGDLLAELGEFDAALAAHREALAQMEQLHGPGDRRLAPYINRIALNNPQLPHDEKIAMFTRSLGIIEGAVGPDDPLVAYYLINLAGELRRDGRYAEALPHLERALELRERALGEDHALVAIALGSLAATLHELGEVERSAALRARQLDITRATYGARSLAASMALFGAAETAIARGEFDRARASLDESMAIKRELYGGAHPYLGFDELMVARSWEEQGEPARGLEHAERAVGIFAVAYGDSSEQLGEALAVRGRLEFASGRPATALRTLERAEGLLAGLREGHPAREEVRRDLARARGGG